MTQPLSDTIVLVFGAGIEGRGAQAQLDQESQYALNWAVNIAQSCCGAPIIALPGYSKKYRVHFGELFRETATKMLCTWAPVDRNDYAAEFNSIGEARAFWRWVAKYHGSQPTLRTVHVVTRGVHSWRTAFLVWKLRPQQYRHIKVFRHQACSDEKGLWWHECKNWVKVLGLLVFRQLRPEL